SCERREPRSRGSGSSGSFFARADPHDRERAPRARLQFAERGGVAAGNRIAVRVGIRMPSCPAMHALDRAADVSGAVGLDLLIAAEEEPRAIRYDAGMFRLVSCLLVIAAALPAQDAPLRLAIAGLAHGHVSGFLRNAKPRADVKIVAVYDPDAALTASYASAQDFAPGMMFNDLGAMLDRIKPE